MFVITQNYAVVKNVELPPNYERLVITRNFEPSKLREHFTPVMPKEPKTIYNV